MAEIKLAITEDMMIKAMREVLEEYGVECGDRPFETIAEIIARSDEAYKEGYEDGYIAGMMAMKENEDRTVVKSGDIRRHDNLSYVVVRKTGRLCRIEYDDGSVDIARNESVSKDHLVSRNDNVIQAMQQMKYDKVMRRCGE